MITLMYVSNSYCTCDTNRFGCSRSAFGLLQVGMSNIYISEPPTKGKVGQRGGCAEPRLCATHKRVARRERYADLVFPLNTVCGLEHTVNTELGPLGS